MSTALRRLPAPLALMALIFVLSAQSDLDSGLGVLDLIGRKLIHAGTYALLTVLWAWTLAPLAVRATDGGSDESGGAIAAATLIALLYAISDEYHQSFVAGRTGTPVDVVIDALGIVLAALVLRGSLRLPGRWGPPRREG